MSIPSGSIAQCSCGSTKPLRFTSSPKSNGGVTPCTSSSSSTVSSGPFFGAYGGEDRSSIDLGAELAGLVVFVEPVENRIGDLFRHAGHAHQPRPLLGLVFVLRDQGVEVQASSIRLRGRSGASSARRARRGARGSVKRPRSAGCRAVDDRNALQLGRVVVQPAPIAERFARRASAATSIFSTPLSQSSALAAPAVSVGRLVFGEHQLGERVAANDKHGDDDEHDDERHDAAERRWIRITASPPRRRSDEVSLVADASPASKARRPANERSSDRFAPCGTSGDASEQRRPDRRGSAARKREQISTPTGTACRSDESQSVSHSVPS